MNRGWVHRAAFALLAVAACSAAGKVDVSPATGAGGASGAAGAPGAGGGADMAGGSAGAGAKGGGIGIAGGGAGPTVFPDPVTCDEAKASRTYLGCDFWPTAVDNIVVPSFDFAAVVANPGTADAQITVTRAGMTIGTATVGAGGLLKVYLPWVPELKSLSYLPGQPDNGCPTFVKTSTVGAVGGAYHLTSTAPVAVYQFNAIEYAGKGGPVGKDWTYCKAHNCLGLSDCYSYTNDASLLLPSTALTGNYRVAGPPPWTSDTGTPDQPSKFTFPAYFAVTGTTDGTSVTVQVSATGAIAAGAGIPAVGPGGKATFTLNAGDVVMIVGTESSDLSGSLVQASAPVQVIAGIACSQMPHGTPACDHLEQNVLPAETLGKHYFVAPPSIPQNGTMGHVVRIYGNVDGTKLTYPGANPGGPATIDAGAFADLGVVTTEFEVVGDHEFEVVTFALGAGPATGMREGDPSMSTMTTVEQYRRSYTFLAPDDYDDSYVDIVQPMDAAVTLDGAVVTQAPVAISSGFGVTRVKLGPGTGGAHSLSAPVPVGIQVMGYGSYTSYQYPGGLNLGMIAPPPMLK